MRKLTPGNITRALAVIACGVAAIVWLGVPLAQGIAASLALGAALLAFIVLLPAVTLAFLLRGFAGSPARTGNVTTTGKELGPTAAPQRKFAPRVHRASHLV